MADSFLEKRREQRRHELERRSQREQAAAPVALPAEGTSAATAVTPLLRVEAMNGTTGARRAPDPASEAPGIAYLIEVIRDLKRENQRYRTAIDNLSVGVGYLEAPRPAAGRDAAGDPAFGKAQAPRFTFASDALVQLTGYTSDELLGRNHDLLLDESVDVGTRGKLLQALESGQGEVADVACRRKDGSTFPAHLVVAPVFDDYGERHATSLILTDLSGGQTAGQDGEEGQQAGGEFRFTTNLIHELRTPLNAIIGFADVLNSEVFGPLPHDKYREYASDILESGRHLLELVNEILDLSKADAGRLELSEGPVDVDSAVRSSVMMIEQTAQEAGVDLSVAIADDLPRLFADERRVRQVLINLLANAVKFTPAGGEVLLTADRESDGGLFVSVLDTGIGMSAEDLSIAVAPFGQVPTARARNYQGTGLGLPLTRKLLEAHGGSLEILSSSGQGTIMVARFPASRVLD